LYEAAPAAVSTSRCGRSWPASASAATVGTSEQGGRERSDRTGLIFLFRGTEAHPAPDTRGIIVPSSRSFGGTGPLEHHSSALLH
jgi:hypothetical protein